MTNHKRPRIERESKTVAAMIALFCRDNHASRELCPECATLLAYSNERLDKCSFQEGKTTCSNCPTHCFKSGMRKKIRAVMRYSGPRMAYRHPLMAVQYIFDRRRKSPISQIDGK